MDISSVASQILQTMGVSGVLVFFLFALLKRLDDKDKQHSGFVDKLLAEFEENVKINEGVKNALERNTEVMNKVLDRFDDTMRSSDK